MELRKAMHERLPHMFPEHRFYWGDSLDSTNLECERRWRQLPLLWVVAADAQTAGRGRYGRVWQSPPGVNLYLSLVWINPFASRIGLLNLWWGVVVWQTLATLFPGLSERLTVKWPNDIYIGPRKLAGILMQNLDAEFQHLVVGIGINVYARTRDIPPQATSLAMELPAKSLGQDARPHLLQQLLEKINDPELVACTQSLPALRKKYWQAAAGSRQISYFYHGTTPVEGTLHHLHDDGTVDIRSVQGTVVHLRM